MEKIKDLRWDSGSIIPDVLAQKYAGPLPFSHSLSQRETNFFHEYDQLLTDYMSDFDIDLSAVRLSLSLSL